MGTGDPAASSSCSTAPPFDTTPTLTLQSEEIAAAQWLEPGAALAVLSDAGQARLRAALAARTGGPVAFLDSHRSA